MVEWIPGAEKSPDRVDALVWALTILNLNAYLGSDFEIPALNISDYEETGYSVVINRFEDMCSDDDY